LSRAVMKFHVFRTYNGKRVIYWPLLMIFVVLSGLAGAMAGFFVLVSADRLQLPLDTLYNHHVLFLTVTALLFATVSLLLSYWLHGRNFSDHEKLEAAPNGWWSFTASSLKQILGRVLFASACLATLIVLFYTEENLRGKRAFRQYQRQLEARGEFLDWKRLVPPPIPDNQNLAKIPLLNRLLDYERSQHGTVWRDTNGSARLAVLTKIISWGVKTKARHTENQEKNELVNLKGYQEYFLLNTNVPHAASPQEPVQDILLGLSPFEPDYE